PVVAVLGRMPSGGWPKLVTGRPSANGMVPPTSDTATPSSAVLFGVYVVPAGIESVSVTPVAGAVPVFWTVMLYLRGTPATTVAGVVFLVASMRAMPVDTVLVVN